MEKNTFNNYFRVKMTLDHTNMDINGFSDPPYIRKSVLLVDFEKNKKIKMAAVAILKMVAS